MKYDNKFSNQFFLFISLKINESGYKTVYQPKAKVFVLYPTNLIDWIRQKKRTASRLYQLKQYYSISKVASLKDEINSGVKTMFYINSLKEVIWFMLLLVMRIYIWVRVLFDARLWRRSFKKTWERVESTK